MQKPELVNGTTQGRALGGGGPARVPNETQAVREGTDFRVLAPGGVRGGPRELAVRERFRETPADIPSDPAARTQPSGHTGCSRSEVGPGPGVLA